MKQAEKKKKNWKEKETEQKENRDEIQSKQLSSVQVFHVFEHIHNQLTCPWLDSYLWAASVKGKEDQSLQGFKKGGRRSDGTTKRSETEWKHLINLSCQTKNRKSVIRNEYQGMQASPQLQASKWWP